MTIYLDYASTTPVDRRVAAAMSDVLTRDGAFGNPSSAHIFGLAARAEVERARAQAAALIGGAPESIVWTASATEANNLAIFGIARRALRGVRVRGSQDRVHLVTSKTEHKAVLNACRQLEREGCDVTYLKPRPDGRIDAAQVAQALRSDTVLVSVMHVNNETGVINDVAAIGAVCRARQVPFHVDAAQGAGRIPVDVSSMHIDLLSVSAHKLYGPKGVGFLHVRRDPPLGLEPLIFGGEQEQGLRSGTLATHQIVGMGLACELAAAQREADYRHVESLRDRLWRGLRPLGGVHLNSIASDPSANVPHILNVSFEGVNGESLVAGLDRLAVASGAACNSPSREASYVLRALGRGDELAQASLRFSFGRLTTVADIDVAIHVVTAAVTHLRERSPAAPPAFSGANVIQGEAGSVGEGAWVRFTVRVDTRPVASAQVYGCPDTAAVAEWLAFRLATDTPDALLTAGARGWAHVLKIPAEKLGRLLVVEDAVRRIGRLWPSH